ncbi:capsule assembly Wzi family protein [Hufsiella ginkgonis]|uniref:Capsule assembly Wzi family protein n=1 Tax=Hufsiella ginkgonis TaxID=2695274 RepID=A0A7K1Y273_9SPHI|nr:capsule assembly Wzi family protein [Hufsiella ginkgonis]MXV17374.1 hypothetical protein [Hufsiella ginkgonis]
MTFRVLLVLVFSILPVCLLRAQPIPVSSPELEDYYRRAQLKGELDSAVSFMVRPLLPGAAFSLSANPFYPDSSQQKKLRINDTRAFDSGNGLLRILPFEVRLQNQTKVPYGWNDGAMIPAKGLQSVITWGVHLNYKALSLTLKPELVTAKNKLYEGFPTEYPDEDWALFFNYYHNVIDLPEQFGTSAYQRLLPGQSSLRVNVDNFSLGLSTENLWWGPGMRNSLIMSNTAPGFFHITLNTIKPVKTVAGSFEGQFIAGRLADSKFAPIDSARTLYEVPIYRPRNTEWRYLSGMVLTWQPRWVKGLFIGYARTSQAYHSDLDHPADYLPFLLPVKRFKPGKFTFEDDRKSDQYASFFMRWLFPRANGEFYLEYGMNNHYADMSRLDVAGGHSRAYVLGIRKLFPLTPVDDLSVNAEVTQLMGPGDYISKPGESWYVNSVVRQGYTHMGQLLGAGTGPASSLQSLDLAWHRKLNFVGLRAERYLHNDDLMYYIYYDARRSWVDISYSLRLGLTRGHFAFTGELQRNKSLNYFFFLKEQPGVFWVPGRDVVNLTTKFSVSYRF